MKKILIYSLFSFIFGSILSGLIIWNVFLDQRSKQVSQIKDEGFFEDRNEKLKKHIVYETRTTEDQTSLEKSEGFTEENYLKRIIQDIINGQYDPMPVAEGRKQNIIKLANRLNLTPEQLIHFENLAERKYKSMRLWSLRDLGLITEQEYEQMSLDIGGMDFEKDLKMFLTEEQIEIYDQKKESDKKELSRSLASNDIQHYHLEDPQYYSPEETELINQALVGGYSDQSQMIIAIEFESLNIEPREKRLLTYLYERLPYELFEKVYYSILEGKLSR